MFKRMYFLILTLFLLGAVPIQAEVIVEENFDSYTWNIDAAMKNTECGGSYSPCGSGGRTAPTGWDGYRANSPTTGTAYIGSLPTSNVDHTLGTTSGHAFIAYYSSAGGDSAIGRNFPSMTEYPEIWSSVWIRAKGSTTVTGPGQKTFRFMRLDPGYDNMWSFFSEGNGCPIWVLTLYSNGSTGGWKTTFRCDPQASAYYCTPDYDSNDGMAWDPAGAGWQDTSWHKIKVHLKMNTSLGASDGIAQLWVDDNLVDNRSNINWRRSGADASGWNQVDLGGNSPPDTSPEIWVAFDDLIVATTEAEVDGEEDETAPTVTATGISGGSGAGCVIR